jgi:hypothetical protein
MNEREGSSSWTLTLIAVSIAIVAVLAVQVFQESCHAIAAVSAGARLNWFNLFAVNYSWVGEVNWWKQTIIAGNPALMNLLTGTIAVALFSRRWVMRRPTLRLFLLYFSAYSLLASLGSLVLDAAFYQPAGQNPDDWAVVLDLLGGNLAVRIVMGLVGLAGEVWVYFWLVRSTLRFGREVAERRQRARLARPLLMEPYLMISAIFLILSIWNPFGFDGFLGIVWLYLLGHIVFFVASFGVVYWTRIETPPPDATPLSDELNWPWCIGAAAALGIASLVLLPTVYF